MSSDLSVCEGSLYKADMDMQYFSNTLLPFNDSSIDSLLQTISNQQNPVEFDTQNIDQLASSGVLSSSPPISQLQNLSIHHSNNLLQQPLPSHVNPYLTNGLSEFSCLDVLDVKAEDCQDGLEYFQRENNFVPHSYSGAENVAKFMRRSYSSNENTFGKRPEFYFKPNFDALVEMGCSQNLQKQTIGSPEDSSFLAGHMRKVCSTGDLQSMRQNPVTQRCFSSPSANENFFMEESNFKVGRYSAEERKEKILKYRAKRSQRNFNKTIKYACRKTLADSRPRIRGRFARNDEVGEIPKPASSNTTRDDDEDQFWLDGLHEEEANGTVRGQYVNSFGGVQFQYYGY